MVINIHIKSSGLNRQDVEKTHKEVRTLAEICSCIEKQIEGEFSENG